MTQMPAGWIEAELGDLLAPLEDGRTIHQGWSPQCEAEPSNDEDMWGVLKTTAIQPGAFLPSHNKRLPETLAPRPAIEVRQGDLLITCAGPRARCGVACLVRRTRRRLMFSGKMYRFRVDDRFIDPRYLEAFLLSAAAQRAIDGMKTGISDSGLNLTHARFRKLRVPLAPRGEQTRIVAAIEEQSSRLEAADGLLRKTDQRLTHLRATIYSRAVQGDWPRVELKSILREPLRNGHSAKASVDGKGVRTLTLTAVTSGKFSDSNTKLTTADPSRVRNLWLQPGDLFVERSNTPELVGTAALFQGPTGWAIFPDLLIRVRVSSAMLPEFLELVFRAATTRQYFRRAAEGIAGSMPKIDQGDVERLMIPVPELDDQRRIVASAVRDLSLVDALADEVARGICRSAALRASILQRAFCGQLVPQDPSEGQASVLLELIAAERASAPVLTRRRKRVPA